MTKQPVLLILLFQCCLFLFPVQLFAQNYNDDDVEVYLDFRHRGIINTVVITYYKDNQFYLPVSELFSFFDIDHQVDGLRIEGNFGTEQIPYYISFQSNQIRFGDKAIPITADDYLIKELDTYLRAEVFQEAFGLDFTIDFSNLSLNLVTDRELPAVQRAIRQQRRRLANTNRYSTQQYELRYNRERPFLDGGFLDYNLSANISDNRNVYNLNSNIGLQVYGGDLQGTIFGNYSDNYSSLTTNNLRWRYMYRDQPWLSKISIGQVTTDGTTPNNYTGIRLTNEPIEPRRLFDEFEIQGNTIPQSEVELYLNNALIDFQQADEMGNYRFLTPVSYGSSQLNLKIYGPTGQIIERSSRIQVPFTFQPEGVFNYHINAGQLDYPTIGQTEQEYTLQGNGGYGITNWLTARAGVEYYHLFHDNLPTFTSSLSSRIFTNYILTLEAASEAYYRGVLNVIYPNAASINIDYTDFIAERGIYNSANDDKRIIASAFYPFSILGLPFNVRASTFTRLRGSTNTSTLRLDANSRLGKLNLRLGYSDRLTGTFDFLNPSQTSYIQSSATYNISRNRNLPEYLRGVFLRAQLRYFPVINEFESVEVLASRNVFSQGRLQISAGRNFTGDFNNIRFSLIVDFNKVRSNTTFNHLRNNNNFIQNIRGSVGYDTNYNNFILTSRDQVGRSGAAIKLFVDNNANEVFDEGDDPIEENAIRIDRSGASSITKNGVLYYTQMQPYFFYNLEVNKGAIRNPMLVPQIEKFGMISDPNRFKKVEVPFYMSGVIEGLVKRQFRGGRTDGVAGLKLTLQQTDGDYTEDIRTFSDGSFYAYEIPPGIYEIRIDSAQLEILGSRSEPDILEFEVKAVPEGDFVEGLNFMLIPKDTPAEVEMQTLDGNCRYGIQMAAFSTIEAAKNFIQINTEFSDSQIVYNQPAKLYAVRHRQFRSFGEASKYGRELNDKGFPDASVFSQCEGTALQELNKELYELQLAAFTNPRRADEYIRDLNSNYEIDAYRIQDQQNLMYKVKVGPFSSLGSTLDRMQEIISKSPLSDFIISKETLEAPIIQVGFEFLIHLGEYSTTEEARTYAEKVENTFGYDTHLLKDEAGAIQVVMNEIIQGWKHAVDIRREIGENEAFQQPVIHLLEKDVQ